MANPFLVLGGIAISVATAAFGILQVPGWVASAQDAAAVNDIAQLSAAQAAAVSETGRYAESVSQLSDSGSVKVTGSAGVRTYTATDPTGKHLLTVARSASGTYFARLGTRTTTGDGRNVESAVEAAGTTITGPSGARTTAEGVPVPGADSGLRQLVYTNLHVNPGAQTSGSYTHWDGVVNSVQTNVVSALWAQSRKAWRVTWPSVTDSEVGDIGVGVGSMVEGGKRYTLTYWATSNADRTLGQPGMYYSVDRELVTMHDRSPAARLVPGTPVLRYVTFTPTAEQAAAVTEGLRSVQTLRGKTDGDYVEVSDVMLYEGDFDPDRPFFSGDIGPAGLEVQWDGTPHRSISHAYR